MSAADEPSHILVVDDDRRIRDLLGRFLHRNGYLVTGARDAGHADRLLESLAFDLMVVDVMMPGEDGVSFTRRVREGTRTPVLLLTARTEIEHRILGLEAGADDYLAKPFEPRELLLRIAAILRRAVPAPVESSRRVLSLGASSYDTGRGQLMRGEELIRLTTTEQALMRVFSAQPNEPVSRARLAEELGGAGGSVQDRAVDVQITRLRRKIEADPKAPRYLQTVRGAGYMLTPD
ncbi:response regulator [Paralimibaculum aggregatum]|uniref:Response regulator n=1 Tax=Paralimibaculum aggregatum TaxID=3036245 RepID=A0ABQ6LJC3_9RHOB|nr:response regulator [Limibaculum sp. NKW23]GMG82496.1 response regulator [Limibaculum sp. NKW23]